jgi:hypothetical protein
MKTPRCPACGSSAVTPDATNGGAGRNVCHCGHRAAVRDFYRLTLHAEPDHMEKIINNNVQFRVVEPGKVMYVTEPVAAVIMPNGELNDMRHNREPAPIRQYKDD